LEEINCNIGVKKGCVMSPTLFGIYIGNLEGCLEEVGCVGVISIGTIIMILLYSNDIVLIERSPYVLEKEINILKDFSLVHASFSTLSKQRL